MFYIIANYKLLNEGATEGTLSASVNLYSHEFVCIHIYTARNGCANDEIDY